GGERAISRVEFDALDERVVEQLKLLDRTTSERPSVAEVERQTTGISASRFDVPRAVEAEAVDCVAVVVPRQFVRLTLELEQAAGDAIRPGDHRKRAGHGWGDERLLRIVGRMQERQPRAAVEEFELVEAAAGFGDDAALSATAL